MLSVELGMRHKGIELAFPSVAELCFFTLHLINSCSSSFGQYPY